MGITTQLPFRPSVYDTEREQRIAQASVALMEETYGDFPFDPGAVLLGVTHLDMYIRGTDWRWRTGSRFGVVTSSRTSTKPTGRFGDRLEVHVGLRKMVTKTIGLLYYRKPMSSDPRSVLYGGVFGLAGLEAIDESRALRELLGE